MQQAHTATHSHATRTRCNLQHMQHGHTATRSHADHRFCGNMMIELSQNPEPPGLSLDAEGLCLVLCSCRRKKTLPPSLWLQLQKLPGLLCPEGIPASLDICKPGWRGHPTSGVLSASSGSLLFPGHLICFIPTASLSQLAFAPPLSSEHCRLSASLTQRGRASFQGFCSLVYVIEGRRNGD